MKHPLHKKMPLWLDIKIRFRLLLERIKKHKQAVSFFGGVLFAPTLAALVLFMQPGDATDYIDLDALIADIKVAQIAEVEKAATGIYHVKRVIVEGVDKPAFVVSELGVVESAERRIDEIETWQHNNTALALVESNGTDYGFEAFLSIEQGSDIQLHHYGVDERSIEDSRKVYDQAHDLASLYAEYQSLDRPTVPILPNEATFVSYSLEEGAVRFVTSAAQEIEIVHIVDIESKLVEEEIIYVLSPEGDKYEMTRITYREREVISAEQFDAVFDPSRFEYEMIAVQQTA